MTTTTVIDDARKLTCGTCGYTPTWVAKIDPASNAELVHLDDGHHRIRHNGDTTPHFHGSAAKGHPIPGTCSCGTRLGCAVHGPQPRERTIPCRWCKCPTWNWDAVCGHCSHPYTGVCCMDEWPEGPGAA